MPEDAAYKKLLLVDVEAGFDSSFKQFLESNGFEVILCGSSTSLLVALKSGLPDVVVIDQQLNQFEGLDLTQLARNYFNGPVIMLASVKDDALEVENLNGGLDDYITRDMDFDLLLARINARLRFSFRFLKNQFNHQNRLTFGDLTIDNAVREAWLNESPIELTGAEFDLLWLLTSNAGQVMTREEIFHRLRGIEYDGQDRSVDVRVSRIRPKVGDDPDHPRRIKTIRSKGYLFVPDVNDGNQASFH